MQTIAGYPTDLNVTEPSALVTVNGVPMDVASLTVTRELSSSLPAQVASASGITAATGSVKWAVGEDVHTRPAHPWDGSAFPPKPADEVIVYMGYGDALARQLTGVVDSSAGSAADGSVSSDLVDRIDKLNKPVTFPAMLRTMPPEAEGGDSLPVNCTPTFITDRILRACGFNATPPVQPGCVLSAPLMGSSWPEVGTVTSSGRRNDPAFPPLFNGADWGMAAGNIDASYAPATSGSMVFDRTVQITFKARETLGTVGNTIVRAYWGANTIELGVTPARRIFGQLNGVTVCEMTESAAATAEVFTLRVTPAGAFTILAGNGQTVTGSATIPAAMATTPMSEVLILSPEGTGVNIGGVQVNWNATAVYSAAQTAILTEPAEPNGLAAFPRVEGRNALDLLKEQAEAECAAMWIDEQGVFRWVNRDVLTGSAPAATLTALDDVLDIGWESNSSGVRSKAILSSRQAKISRFPTSSVTLYTGSGESLQSGETAVDIAEPSADESWFGLDLTGGAHAQYNQGQRTMWGGVVVKDATADVWAPDAGKLGVTLDLIAPDKMVITHTAGTLGAGETVVLKTSAGDPNLIPFRRDKNLPIIRGKARVRWTDIETLGAMQGPPDAAALEHDVGPWVQDPAGLQVLADWLAVQVAEPQPVLRDLAVIPDFRRQLGDIVWVEDPEALRIRLRVLITRISTTVGPGIADQTIAGRILEVQDYGTTNDELDVHAGPYTNTSFDTLWADATNTALDADPLERG